VKQKSGSLKKQLRLTGPWQNWLKWEEKKTQINKIRNANGEITIDTMEIQEIIRDYIESLYSNKFENLKEMDRFIETYKTEPRGC
jgi:hypothetical protein